jgi:hypothetical protein
MLPPPWSECSEYRNVAAKPIEQGHLLQSRYTIDGPGIAFAR